MRDVERTSPTQPLPLSEPDAADRIGILSIGDATPWLRGTALEVSGLADLPDNWDGCGSLRLQAKALSAAFDVLRDVDTEQPPRPNMGLIPGGGMQIEWHTPTRELEIEILPDGSIEYVKIEGNEYDDGSVQHVKRHKAIELVRWLMHKS